MKGELLSGLPIEDLSPDGRGVGFIRLNGKASGRGVPVFVSGALPGQIVSCLTLKDKKTFLEATLQKIETRTGKFVEPQCPNAAECGGCPLQTLPYAAQLAWKEKFVRDALVRIGKFRSDELDAARLPIAPSPLIKNFRDKIELAFGEDKNGNAVLGFRGGASRLITPVRSCALVDSAANGIVASFQRLARGLRDILPRFLILRRGYMPGSEETAWFAILKVAKAPRQKKDKITNVAASLFEGNPDLAIFALEATPNLLTHSQPGKRALVLNRKLETRPGDAIFELPLLNRRFSVDLSSFFQVNPGAADKLAGIVKEFDGDLSGGVLLDLYCGVGAPGLLIAGNHDRLIGAEINPASAKLAKRNDRFGNCEFYAGDSGAILKKFVSRAPRTILLDPPRSGLNDATLSGVLASNPERIIYVSCNPATFARDAAKLRARFELVRLAPVDMFPHTPHAEIASLWVNKRAKAN